MSKLSYKPHNKKYGWREQSFESDKAKITKIHTASVGGELLEFETNEPIFIEAGDQINYRIEGKEIVMSITKEYRYKIKPNKSKGDKK